MQISFCNGNDKAYQKLLNDLLEPIFFDFKFWYDLDLWDSQYESYAVMQDGEMISNICVFKTQVLLNSVQHQALSVGAVATKAGLGGQGHARLLMEHIINKYQDMPMYLFANETVLDFYPRFGFKRIYEKLPVAHQIIHNDTAPRNLALDDPIVWESIFHRINYSSILDCLNTASINLFHVYYGHLKECIYHIPELETVVIAQQDAGTLKIFGVFSTIHISFEVFTKFLPFKNVNRIEFGFMPCWSDLEFEMQNYDTDPLFVRNIKCGLGDFKFPELSIT